MVPAFLAEVIVKSWIAALLLLPVLAAPAAAESGSVSYISLFPALVGNYGEGPRLTYYKADVALRVGSDQAGARVRHHEPLIRNQLVMLFSEQTSETLGTPEGKEQLRQIALKRVQDTLAEEEGAPLVDDLLFNNLVVQ